MDTSKNVMLTSFEASLRYKQLRDLFASRVIGADTTKEHISYFLELTTPSTEKILEYKKLKAHFGRMNARNTFYDLARRSYHTILKEEEEKDGD